MSTETKQLYKLIILYLLDHVEYPLSNSRLTEFFGEKQYAPYFNVQQALAELVEDNYVAADKTRNTTRYSITPSGSQTLTLFIKDISPDICIDIKDYLRENSISIREDSAYPADYTPLENGEFKVRLRILERNQPIFELHLYVPTKEAAERVCSNWDKKNADVYRLTVENLLPEHM